MSIKDRDREIVWLLCEDIDDLKYDRFVSSTDVTIDCFPL